MSLLMKALEKAAKDRVEARVEPAVAEPAAVPPAAPAPAPAVTAPRSELTLEPLRADWAATTGAEAPAKTEGKPPPRPAAPASAREQAQAATVLQAGGARGGTATATLGRPLVLFGIVVALAVIGFGTYVYLQVFHPSLFYPSPAPAKPPASPIGTAPSTGTVPATGAVPPPAPAGAPETAAAPVPGAAPSPIPAAPVLKEGASETVAAVPTPAPTAAPPASPRAQAEPVAAAAPPAPAAARREIITVTRGSTAPTVHPVLNEAYSALQSGELERSQRLYERLVGSEPRNADALLGLAAIATLEGRNDEAIRRYMQVLELDPRNALAQSGLIGLLGRADPQAGESRLRQLIAREPSAFLYFTLGNLYADQQRWAQAQQAYFQAHYLEPSNPDYAYNLAVALEHLSQSRLALGFYRRALQLAGNAARPHFNIALAQDRISKLASQVE